MSWPFFLLFASILPSIHSKFGVSTASKFNIKWRQSQGGLDRSLESVVVKPKTTKNPRTQQEEEDRKKPFLVTARQVGMSIGEVTDAMEVILDFSGKDKADLVALAGTRKIAGTKLSYFAKLTKAFSIFRHFEGVGILVDLITGESVASQRHKAILERFRQQDQKLDQLSAKLERQTDRVINAIWDSHARIAWIDTLKTVSDNYADYLKVQSKLIEDKIVYAYKYDVVSKAVNGIKGAIFERAKSLGKAEQDCRKIVDLKTEITMFLVRPYLAYKLGCELEGQRIGEKNIAKVCNTNGLPDIKTIHSQIDRAAMECRSVRSVNKFVKDFIEEGIDEDDSIQEAGNKISYFISERFPYMTYVGAVYSPHHGFEEHTTNAGITKFRYYNKMNIAVDIREPCKNYPACKTVKRACLSQCKSNGFPKGIILKSSEWFFDCKPRVQDDAKEFYDKYSKALEIYRGKRNYGLIVFKDDDDDDWSVFPSSPDVCQEQVIPKGNFGGADKFQVLYNYGPY